jgi:hypothetical protein
MTADTEVEPANRNGRLHPSQRGKILDFNFWMAVVMVVVGVAGVAGVVVKAVGDFRFAQQISRLNESIGLAPVSAVMPTVLNGILMLFALAVVVWFGIVCRRRWSEVRDGRLVVVTDWTHDFGKVHAVPPTGQYPLSLYRKMARVWFTYLVVHGHTYRLDPDLEDRVLGERVNTVVSTPRSNILINVLPPVDQAPARPDSTVSLAAPAAGPVMELSGPAGVAAANRAGHLHRSQRGKVLDITFWPVALIPVIMIGAAIATALGSGFTVWSSLELIVFGGGLTVASLIHCWRRCREFRRPLIVITGWTHDVGPGQLSDQYPISIRHQPRGNGQGPEKWQLRAGGKTYIVERALWDRLVANRNNTVCILPSTRWLVNVLPA